MASIEELLASTALTDDIEVALPNGTKLTVGDLRSFQKAQVAAAAAVEARRKEADQEWARARGLSDDALKAIEVAERTKAAPAPKAEDKSGIDWDIDPVYAPVGKRFKEYEATLTEKLAKLDQLNDAVGQGLKFVTQTYLENRWKELGKDAPKDKSWRDYVKIAQDQKINDQWGLPDPIAAYMKETESTRLATAVENARKEGIAEGKKSVAAAAMPRPGGMTAPRTTDPRTGGKDAGSKDFNTSLRESFAKAANDPEILKIAGIID